MLNSVRNPRGSSTSGGVAHSPGSTVGPAGYAAALQALQNPSAKCLGDLDATSAKQATQELTGSTIAYTYGTVPWVNPSTGAITNGATSASSNAGTNSITINLDFGWYTPTSVIAINTQTLLPFTINFLASVGNSIGDPNLTAAQYYELTILHELGHNLGVPQETSSAYNQSIFNDCIK